MTREARLVLLFCLCLDEVELHCLSVVLKGFLVARVEA